MGKEQKYCSSTCQFIKWRKHLANSQRHSCVDKIPSDPQMEGTTNTTCCFFLVILGLEGLEDESAMN